MCPLLPLFTEEFGTLHSGSLQPVTGEWHTLGQGQLGTATVMAEGVSPYSSAPSQPGMRIIALEPPGFNSKEKLIKPPSYWCSLRTISAIEGNIVPKIVSKAMDGDKG